MTKRERLETILKEIPCLYEDYQNNEVKRYSLFGSQDMTPDELKEALTVVGKNQLLCVIEQDSSISGERMSFVNYIMDSKGYKPQKKERISPAIFSSGQRNVDVDDYRQTAYVFQAYCYNATWNQYDHGEIGIMPFENTIIRVW